MDVGAADPVSNIRATVHNLSKSGTGTVKSSTETEICVFCHTPHNSNVAAVVPLWNRTGYAASYDTYKSASLDSTGGAFASQPAGSSLLCLSCHDGTVALGSVKVLRGVKNPATISVSNANPSAYTNTTVSPASMVQDGMPSTTALKATGNTLGSAYTASDAAQTGFTRLLGTNLSNDHPISVTYDQSLVTADGEMRAIGSTVTSGTGTRPIFGVRARGEAKPLLPLLPTGPEDSVTKLLAGQVQCATCHDPHITNKRFLRLNRLQTSTPIGTAFDQDKDIICLACHEKGGTEWANSVHARSDIGTYKYKDTAAYLRDFPLNTEVYQAACLNCHDTHTVPGARRLLREGTNDTNQPKKGGKSAIEETCYQCHTYQNSTTVNNGSVNVTTPGSVLTLPTFTSSAGVPNIWAEFQRAVRMPITNAEQGSSASGVTAEAHEITSANFIESADSLGKSSTGNRHVECTDCHNPHRVRKDSVFYGTGAGTQRTHIAGGTAANKGADGNVASGVLRGIWGVEPTYKALTTAWPDSGTTYVEKKGIPTDSSTDRSKGWLTREYQLCFKCHSGYSNGTFPDVGVRLGGTKTADNNGLTKYTNVAAEFAVNATDPPTTGTDQGEIGVLTGGTSTIEPTASWPADQLNASMRDADTTKTHNHRSWHPAVWPTGRTRDERRMISTGGNFRAPFDTRVGTQTMHCSDCHGHSASWTAGTGPDLTQVQGPHGSDKPFLLKGDWSTAVTIGGSGLCFNCHNPTAGTQAQEGIGDGTARPSGFNNNKDADGCSGGGGHGNAHASRPCMRCHVAVPHGWKNKAFLVNLNCVGTEAGQTGDCVRVTVTSYTQQPYYQSATLRVVYWRSSGNWNPGSCGDMQKTDKQTGKDWMTDGSFCQ